MILSNDLEIGKKMNSSIFPGLKVVLLCMLLPQKPLP